MSSDPHISPIKTPRQLITVGHPGVRRPGDRDHPAGHVRDRAEGRRGRYRCDDAGGDRRAAASGRYALPSPARQSDPRTLQDGEAVYKLACSACHATGAAGAPKTGDAVPGRLALKQGYDTLVKHAVEGFKAMPARGGNADLDPIEVARAVATWRTYRAPSSRSRTPAAAVAKTGCAYRRTDRAGVVRQLPYEGLNGAPKIGDRCGLDQARVHGNRRRRWQRPSRDTAACRRAVAWLI